MYKIFIDSSERKFNKISIDKDGVILESIEGDIDIVSSMEKLLTKYHLNPSDIDEAVPNQGPGSYTGLRVGVTVANVFNLANGKITLKDQKLPFYASEPHITPPNK